MRDLRTKLAQEAQRWLDADCLVLDTETTGLDSDAEAIEISIIDARGATLLDTLIRPTRPIPAAATKIHGIKNSDVATAPRFEDIHDQFWSILEDRLVVIYNAEYDERILWKTSDLYSLFMPDFESVCAMKLFSNFYAGKLRSSWQKLGFAADYCNVSVQGAHRALADCKMTLGVVQHIARHEK